jgi:hypothetical protein
MRKLFYSILFAIIFHALGYAQNNAKFKIVLAQKTLPLRISTIKNTSHSFLLESLSSAAIPQTTLQSFISALPLIQLNKAAGKKSKLFFTEFSFGELLETAFNKVNTSLINTYDDEVPELFKDAPFTLKVKCIISL